MLSHVMSNGLGLVVIVGRGGVSMVGLPKLGTLEVYL